MSTQLDQIAKKAKSNPKLRFTSLAHLLTPEFLTETWKQMNRRGASGVDGETTKEFEQGLDTRVQELCERLKRGAYRAPPVRRVEIPKGPGKAGTRPLGIPTVADRLLQRAVARILEAVFEADFLDCSYGFRPGRNPLCRAPGRAGPGQAGDVRFPGVDTLLHHQEGRYRLPTRAQDTEKANESQAPEIIAHRPWRAGCGRRVDISGSS